MFIIFMWLGVYGHKMNPTGLAKPRIEGASGELEGRLAAIEGACLFDFPGPRARSSGEEEREYVFDW